MPHTRRKPNFQSGAAREATPSPKALRVPQGSKLTGQVSGDGRRVSEFDLGCQGIGVGASAVVSEELFVFGGMYCDEVALEVRNRRKSHAFFPAKMTWRTLKPMRTPIRGLTGVALDDRHIYLAGGFTEVFTAEAFLYEVQADTDQPAKALPYEGRAPLVKSGGFLYCLGGEDKMKSWT